MIRSHRVPASWISSITTVLEISIKVDEYDLSEITEGMDAEVSIEAIGKTVTGTISEIARGASVDNGVSYFETTITLPQDDDLRVGLSAEVKVVTESANDAVTVPVSAVTYNGAKAYVQKYNDSGSLENTEVTVGDQQLELTSRSRKVSQKGTRSLTSAPRRPTAASRAA